MAPDSLGVFTEFGVAIAGFSGIALAIAHRGGRLVGTARFRTIVLLTWALAPTFAATFPILAQSLGAEDREIWRFSSAAFAALAGLVVLVPFRLRRALDDAERAQLSPFVWSLAVSGNSVLALLLAANAIGPASPAPIVVGLLWHLAVATLLFARLLLIGPAQEPE